MLSVFGRYINKTLRFFNLRILPLDKYQEMYFQAQFYWNDPFLDLLKHPEVLRDLVPKSKAQVRQDLFAISESNFKRDGYFVEVGAQDGILGSNTYMLENDFSWDGIVVEPSKTHEYTLSRNRKCKVEHCAIWSSSGLTFQFVDLGHSGLSTFKNLMKDGIHGKTRSESTFQQYDVQTLSLNDLLEKHNAPRVIDFLSIDTEGSEYEILANFDFNKHDVRIITVEHNYEEIQRSKIYDKLTKAGFVRKYTEISHQDDWYVKN